MAEGTTDPDVLSMCQKLGNLDVKEPRSLDDMKRLRTMAFRYKETNSWSTIKWMYKDKQPEDFMEMTTNNPPQLTLSLKPDYGDPDCPTIGKVMGSFFGVNLDFENNEPFARSKFGPRRLKIPIDYMFKVCPNIYFSDFYCVYKDHHVSLVMTRGGSPADVFCRTHLPKLKLTKNSFLKYCDGNYKLSIRNGVWFQIFFTENIPLNMCSDAECEEKAENPAHVHLPWQAPLMDPDDGSFVMDADGSVQKIRKHYVAYFEDVPWQGNKRRPGRRKNAQCKICNL